MPARRSYKGSVDLPCDCREPVTHKTGDRVVECECGTRYVIRAKTVTTVTYEVEVDGLALFA